MSEPTLARPVFSTEDFALIKTMIKDYVRTHQDDSQTVKLVNLYHRIGRLAPDRG